MKLSLVHSMAVAACWLFWGLQWPAEARNSPAPASQPIALPQRPRPPRRANSQRAYQR